MLNKKRFGSLQNDLKKKALLALAATGIAFGSLGGIAVAQENESVSSNSPASVLAAAGEVVETTSVQVAPVAGSDLALFASAEAVGNAVTQHNMSTEQAALFAPVDQINQAVVQANSAAWSNPVDITVASTTVADPSQFNSLASVLAAAEGALGANGGTVTSVNAGDSTPWWAVSLIVFGATAALMALTYFAMTMVAAARRPSLSPMGA